MSPPTSRHSRWEPADLVQHQIISAIAARQQRVPRVVFKGGTLLRVCYRHDWRFSEDLDFDWIHADDSKQAIHEFFDLVLIRASRAYGTAFDTKWGANKLNIYWELPEATTGVIYTDVKSRRHPGAPPIAVPWTILGRSPRSTLPIPSWDTRRLRCWQQSSIALQTRAASPHATITTCTASSKTPL